MSDAKGPDGPERRSGVEVGGSLGGLFRGLGSLLDLIADLEQKGKTEFQQQQVVQGPGETSAVFGVSVRLGLGGQPVVQSFGNVRPGPKGPAVEAVREPVVDVLDEGETFRLVAELPGVNADEITVEVRGDVVTLQTTGRRKYAREILLPAAVDPVPQTQTYANGVAEICLRKRAAGAAGNP